MKNLHLLIIFLLTSQLGFAQMIDGAEYFWDDDPGVGNGTFISLAPSETQDVSLNISPIGLKQGEHLLGVRTHREDGVWGATRTHRIVVHEYTGAEYFWDQDPGVGNGTFVGFSSVDQTLNSQLEISFEGIPGGRHLLGMRTQGIGNQWTPAYYTPITVPTIYSDGEYYWDTDPGVGFGTPFSLPESVDTLDATVAVNNTGLSRGWHTLYTRIRAKHGSFGPPKAKRIFITRTIVGGEYFWDVDPGVGNGTPIGTLSIGTSAQVCDDIPTIGLSEGDHYLYVRTVGDDGVWSIPVRVQITVTPNENIVGCPGDLNRDGVINSGDLIILLAAFGSDGECSADLTGDFVVNTNDLVFFLALFGSTCD